MTSLAEVRDALISISCTLPSISSLGDAVFRFLFGLTAVVGCVHQVFDYSRDNSNMVSTYSESEGGYAYSHQVVVGAAFSESAFRKVCSRWVNFFVTIPGFAPCRSASQ
jgi:hypothetical protein